MRAQDQNKALQDEIRILLLPENIADVAEASKIKKEFEKFSSLTTQESLKDLLDPKNRKSN